MRCVIVTLVCLVGAVTAKCPAGPTGPCAIVVSLPVSNSICPHGGLRFECPTNSSQFGVLCAPNGTAGPPGPTGPQGSQGIQGALGATGPVGPQGIQGIPGPGLNGTKISVGSPECPTGGYNLTNEQTGVFVAKICNGDVGQTGSQGNQGIPGIQGIPGPGLNGTIILPGSFQCPYGGYNLTNALTGAFVLKVCNGDVGQTGAQGIQGIPGLNASFTCYGNTVCIDQTFGDDTAGARQGRPFRTITAGLAAALTSDEVLIRNGNYDETITIPAGVHVRCSNTRTVFIRKQNVTTATDLVTMGEHSRLSYCQLQLTSRLNVQLRGVVFPGTTTATAQLRDIGISIDNSAANATLTSDVIAIYSNGTGVPISSATTIRDISIRVQSAGLGTKRCLLVQSASTLNIRSFSCFVDDPTTAFPNGSFIGVETVNSPSATVNIQGGGQIDGETADISRTAGRIDMDGIKLINLNANGFGFTTFASSRVLKFADSGGLVATGSRFYRVNMDSVSGTERIYRMTQRTLVKRISACLAVPPTGSASWVLRRGGSTGPLADTALVATISGAVDAIAVNEQVSIRFEAGDQFSLRIDTVGFTTAGGQLTAVDIDLY